MRGPELRRAIRHTDVDTILASADLLGRDIAHELEQLLARAGARTTGAQLFLPDAPFLRRVWLAGAADPPPWATRVPVFADLARRRRW